MRILWAISSSLIAVLALGCAPLPWQKPGAEAAAVDDDVRQCEQQANVNARKLASSGIGDKPVVGVSPRGQAGVVRSPNVTAPIDPVAEDDYFRACMHDKGYSRGPVK